MKTKLFALLYGLLLVFSLRAQEKDVFLIDPIIEVPSPLQLFRFSQSETKDYGFTMMDPTKFHLNGFKGQGVVVFVIDTGIESEHEDLKGTVIGRKNYTSDKTVTNGHGTWCASRIASPENNIGVVGIAPGVVLYDLQVLDGNGSGSSANVAAAYRDAADIVLPAPYQNWKRVTSASLGSYSPMPEVEKAMYYAFTKGVVHVAAAGNNYSEGSNTINYPGKYKEYAITVGALDALKQPAYFSSAGAELDISAPGVSLDGAWTGGSYRKASGTSMATPGVAGAVALMLQKNPDLKGHAVVEAFTNKYATDVFASGYDVRTGYGLVYLPKYYDATEIPDKPDDPTPPDTTKPAPPVVLKSRVLSIPIEGEFTIMYGKSSGGAFRFAKVAGIVVEYQTTEPVEVAKNTIQRAVQSYHTNRGYVLPDNQFSTDFAVGWADYFMNMILKSQGITARMKYAWASEDFPAGRRVVIYYDNHFPVSAKEATKLVKQLKVKTLTWN